MMESVDTKSAIVSGLIAGTLLYGLAHDACIGSVRDVYDGTLPLMLEVNTFRHIDHVFPSAIVKQGDHPFPLAQRT